MSSVVVLWIWLCAYLNCAGWVLSACHALNQAGYAVALGLGGLKLKLHRECVGKMFEATDKVFDAENIYAQAKELA